MAGSEQFGPPGYPVQVRRRFWQGLRQGLTVTESAAAAGVSRHQARIWLVQRGGVNPYPNRPQSGRFLSVEEREEIACGLAAGDSQAVIARRLGRSRSTISREVKRNSPWQGPRRDHARRAYRARLAQSKADRRARRPKTTKLQRLPPLHHWVQQQLDDGWSPQQVSARIAVDFPDDPFMRISHETIYKAIYVQGRGQLKRELVAQLRTGRSLRKPRRGTHRARGGDKFPGMVNISARPAEAADRAVPGHWEGDLIIGANQASAIGTLVERTTRYVMLVHLPARRDAVSVAAALTAQVQTLPDQLKRSLAWDQGNEMAEHAQFTIDTGVQVYFCDPHSPWQRGSNENTNGLLRQYFPKGTSLRRHTPADLDDVAAKLNRRPRKTLGWRTPAEALNQLLSQPDTTNSAVATTA